MKKTNIKTVFMLACMTFGFALTARAQFYSSEQVYCYQYEKTVNDGISSKRGTDFYFVNFQRNMMGLASETNLQRVRQKLLENPEYYSELAIKDLASGYNEWKTQPAFSGSALACACIWLYCDEFSTSSKYTYRLQCKRAESNFNFGPQAWWGKPYWESKCYSFSRDRSEMIIWKTSDPENRDYYKLVDVNSLKPNTDFLD